jgi:hypothetical protein
LLTFALTIALFPFEYNHLLAMQMLPVLLLNLRNLLVVALLLWLLIDRAPSSWRVALAWPIQSARQLLQR